LRQLSGDPESSHPSSAMSICSDWKLQPLPHQQVMNPTWFGGNFAAPKLLTSGACRSCDQHPCDFG
jgi:hypothetical protein